MKVLFVASECNPFIKVGGLADVVGSLPLALKKQGVEPAIFLPFYKNIRLKEKPKLIFKNLCLTFEGKKQIFSIYKTFLGLKVPVYLLSHSHYFDEVYPSGKISGKKIKNEARRFIFLSLVTAHLPFLNEFQIIHCHDWHTGLVPYFLKQKKSKIKTLITLHNPSYQGIQLSSFINKLLNTSFSQKKINILKLGIKNADLVSTVSPSYARELLNPKYGFGLSYLLKKKKPIGILNGLDENLFDPKKDRFILKTYSLKTIKNKQKNKIYLQKKIFGQSNLSAPVLAIISRLAPQKGIDLIKEIFPLLMRENLQFIVLGKGHKRYELFFKKMKKRYQKKFWAKTGFDEKLAHQIYAGSDIFLMPSYFEPCGLGQQIAMKYGTIPVARAIGGIKDTVIPVKINKTKVKGTGFLFKRYTPTSFLNKIQKALQTYQDKKIWIKIQKNAMGQDFSWQRSAQEYIKIYQSLLSNKKSGCT